MKTLKRAFSLFVALVMCLSVMSLPAFAETIDEPAQDVTESISDEPSTDPVTEDEAAPAETGETGKDAAEEPAEEEPAEEEPTEEIVEEPEAAEKPVEEIVEELPAPEKPALTEEELAALEAARLAALERRWPKSDKELVFDTESYRVTVTVPESAFADHVYFRVIEMQWAELDEATAELLKANGLTEDDALLDIGFEDADGFEVEPDVAIGVSIEAAEVEIAEVYHVEDEETVAKVAEDVAEFEVGSFSLYVVKATNLTAQEAVLYSEDNCTKYAKLEDALAAAWNGGTVKLLENVTVTDWKLNLGKGSGSGCKDLVLDGNGYT